MSTRGYEYRSPAKDDSQLSTLVGEACGRLSLSLSRGLEVSKSTTRLLESTNTRGVSGRQRSTCPLQECRLDSTETPLILLLGQPSSHGDSALVPRPKSRTSICAAW